MLNVQTLWTAFTVNFLALGLIWAYVMRSYPNLESARFWTASSLVAVASAISATTRYQVDSYLPLILAGGLMIFSMCLAAMGVQRFYGRPVWWWQTMVLAFTTCVAALVFLYGYDSALLRITWYSISQSLPLIVIARLVLDPRTGRINPGARLAGVLSILIMAMFAVRVVGTALGANFAFSQSGFASALVVLLLIFLSMSLNFGFLLMAVERLRNEVADLALLDDLTGVGNRRHLMQRLTQECARSERSGQPFALLVIDIDGFKTINDSYGHAAGDACLQHFTLMAQTRLRPGDMLARSGGDEFCIVLPDSGLDEAGMIARRVLQVCRDDAEACAGADIPISVSIGVAEWTQEIGAFPDRLVAHADQALYVAKKDGKNCYALYDGAPSLMADVEALVFESLRTEDVSVG